jgi:hypothetical protein
MKRVISLLIITCLLLCACGATPEETVAPTQQPTETTQETTVETTVVTEPPVVTYVHPLTGETLDAPYSGRVTTVVMGNTKTALPQHGISQAEICYEIETEGGITRMLGVFANVENVEKVGPVRSARTFFNNVTMSYDGTIVHCGGSVRGRNAGYDDKGKISDWNHLDQTYNGSYFYRDKARRSSGYATEHTLFAEGEKLVAGIGSKGFRTASESEVTYGLQFDENVVLGGAAAKEVTVKFAGTKTTTMAYDEATGLYSMSQYGKKTVDGNDNKQVTFKNVMVLFTSQWKIHDGEYKRSYYDLIGGGDGYLAINGQIVPIKWNREDLEKPFNYTLEDGTPITLGVGNTYIAVSSVKSGDVTYK